MIFFIFFQLQKNLNNLRRDLLERMEVMKNYGIFLLKTSLPGALCSDIIVGNRVHGSDLIMNKKGKKLTNIGQSIDDL